MHARVRQRVHLLHHQRRYVPSSASGSRHALITSWVQTASEKCQQEKRKTVNGEDILFAMTSLGFENYGEALKIYLARYREVSRSYILFAIVLSISTLKPALTERKEPCRTR